MMYLPCKHRFAGGKVGECPRCNKKEPCLHDFRYSEAYECVICKKCNELFDYGLREEKENYD